MAKENKRQKQNAPKQQSSGTNFLKVIANIGGAIIAGIFLTIVFKHNEPDPQNPADQPLNRGYDWLLNIMLKGNLETIEKYPDLTTQQRYEMKWGGGEISYVFKVKNETPDSAVILFPPKKNLQDVGFKSVVDLPWATYFLYPRKVVYQDDSTKNPFYAQADYLISINGWGLDKSPTPVAQPQAFMILKLK